MNMGKFVSAEEAISKIKSGQKIFVHGAAATPTFLLAALENHLEFNPSITDLEFIHLHTMGRPFYLKPEYRYRTRVANLFVGENIRKDINYGSIDYIPCFLSEIPKLFRAKIRPLDVALIHVSPPDAHGFVSLGTSVDVARAAVDSAPIVIAQVNENMPRVLGDGLVHISNITAMVKTDAPIYEAKPTVLTPEEIQIGKNVAELIEDGATLQAGIGSVPDAVLKSLKNRQNLGLHTEMWSDGALELLECGAIDNTKKFKHTGKSVSGFVLGSRRLYDYIHDNPSVAQLDIAYVNNPTVISRNPKMTAINSAVEIDLTGQICADSVGHRIISGVGGQMDFIRGASLSDNGKPIIAITSRAKNGQSRIVSELKPGAGVVTTRAHVNYVVTEYGIAELFGKTLGERAQAIIKIAHPNDRDRLLGEWGSVAES
jgi:acyl-CoA hydrolase